MEEEKVEMHYVINRLSWIYEWYMKKVKFCFLISALVLGGIYAKNKIKKG